MMLKPVDANDSCHWHAQAYLQEYSSSAKLYICICIWIMLGGVYIYIYVSTLSLQGPSACLVCLRVLTSGVTLQRNFYEVGLLQV